MRQLKIIAAIALGAIGTWLLLWDLIDYLTQGLNHGIWDYLILQTAFPSIFVGFCLVMVASYLGVSVFRG